MNFKPILFSTEMVQAILEGRKVQTRRVVKKGKSLPNCEKAPISTHECGSVFYFWGFDEIVCPYGAPGDILWVRETFASEGFIDNYIYKADGVCHETDYGKWKPSIFMPKEACRLFLKIKSIKVERLQEISENDAIAEGVKIYYYEPVVGKDKAYLYEDYVNSRNGNLNAKDSFSSLWESINGKESLEKNPWVWVIEFEKIEEPENFL